jgi:hypothetical protein
MPTPDNEKKTPNEVGFLGYAGPRLVLAVIVMAAVVGGTGILLDRLKLAPISPSPADHQPPQTQVQALAVVETENQTTEKETKRVDTLEEGTDIVKGAALHPTEAGPDQRIKGVEPDAGPSATTPVPLAPHPPSPADEQTAAAATPHIQNLATEQSATPAPPIAAPAPPLSNDRHLPAPQPENHPAPQTHVQQPPAPVAEPKHSYRPAGVAFVEAVVQPLDHELHRFWGWRPNDIVNLTDNINNFQLGVLEVTRRTTVQLAERISRTGSTDAFDPQLENAMNSIMVTADSYWFPAPESKYQECLKELETYKQKLIRGTASFYTRTDTLIPLLMAYEDLLGSSDENLVKHEEMDGSKVSMFKSDNYFYYAKGVASTMAAILEAIQHDFAQPIENRNGGELLHHAIASCRIAAELDPLFITNSDLDGLFANHRANMAAPISHARFYIGQLIKTLST